ncbi:MAG: multidrug efflux MFS transporter [Ktedonobacteraceae bacterium]|nr:multidrug efflux MFS transporter [Ktedonobacteraceae bacterium]
MAVLDDTIVNVALPQMQHAFRTDFQTVTWVATAYLLAQAAVIPIVGYLGDRFGSKRIFLLALAVFTLGSALCTFAYSKEWLIAFRVIQGIGAGLLLPLAMAMIYRLVLPSERGIAAAIIGVPILLAPAFGPTAGGYLSTNFDWHAIFIINIPIGVLAFILAITVLREDEVQEQQGQNEPRRFDIAGLLLAMVGCCALVYGIELAGSHGWGDSVVLASLIGGSLVLVAFTFVELRASDPVIDVRLFLNYTFSVSNLLMWVMGAMLFGGLFLIPFFFENVRGASALTAGQILIGQGVAGAAGTALSGWLYNRVGPRILCCIGLSLMAIGTFGLTRLDSATTGQSLQFWLILSGFGLSMANTPLYTLTLSVVSNKAIARASSLVNATRMVFSAMGIALLTTYLAQRATLHAAEVVTALRMRPLTGVAATCARAAGSDVSALQRCIGLHTTVMGFNDAFMLVLIMSAACVVLSLFLGRDPALETGKRARKKDDMSDALPLQDYV